MDAKALLGAVAGRFLFRHGVATAVTALSEHFTRIDVRGAELDGAEFVAGDKVQVFLPGLGMRTYTPVTWDRDATWFVGFKHGEGPGSKWVGSVKVGDEVAMMGPRRSIDSQNFAGPLVLLGDETSLAVAVAIARTKPLVAVLEARVPDEVRRVAAAIGLEDVRVEARGDVEALARHVPADATPIFTGNAKTIQALKQRGLRGGKAKAYWAEGKRGLD